MWFQNRYEVVLEENVCSSDSKEKNISAGFYHYVYFKTL